MSDQHNPRFRGGYSVTDHGEPVSTPTLDRLADRGTEFDWAYCGMPLCTPSRLCLLTGRQAADAGAWGNEDMLPPDAETIADSFSAAGYETGLVGKMHLGGRQQFAGFDHRPYGDLTGRGGHQFEPPNPQLDLIPDWEALLTETGTTNIPESLHQEQTVVQESISFLREQVNRDPDQPWFLCASFNRPHWPRTAPQRFLDEYWPDGVTPPSAPEDEAETADHPVSIHRRQRYAADAIDEETTLECRAAYFACISYLDEMLNDLLTTLERDGFLEDTIVVYVSDHGEMAGEHGLWEKNTWHEGSSRVPFFVSLPDSRFGDEQPASVETPVSLIDLYPTLAGLAEIETPNDLDGHDLSKALLTGAEPDRDPVFVDNFHRADTDLNYRIVRDGTYKYVHCRNVPDLFFDLSEDPLERWNALETATGEAREACERLRKRVTESIDFEEIDEQFQRDTLDRAGRELTIPRGNGNTYLLPDGRVIDADAFLYSPHVFTDQPEAVFSDFPGDRQHDE